MNSHQIHQFYLINPIELFAHHQEVEEVMLLTFVLKNETINNNDKKSNE